jgi:hypothetical protein
MRQVIPGNDGDTRNITEQQQLNNLNKVNDYGR